MACVAAGPSACGDGQQARGSVGATKRVVAAHVLAIVLGRVAIDERARVKRVREAPHLVLESKQALSARRVDDVAEAVLVLARLLGNEPAPEQAAMGTGEIG